MQFSKSMQTSMSRQAIIRQLRTAGSLIAPSMLKCDFGNLHREIELLESAGAQLLHLDVMDGHFVPNLSYGPMVIKRLRQLTNLTLDVHLMIDDPDKSLEAYIEAGCDCVTFHFEAAADPVALLHRIRDRDVVAGLALKLDTEVEAVKPALPDCDLVLVMSVEPGFGGQQFIPSALDKLRELSRLIEPGTVLAVDGGIDSSTIRQAAAAGANLFVVGSVIFDAEDYAVAIEELSQLATEADRRQTDQTSPSPSMEY